jgi:hypothetical protein
MATCSTVILVPKSLLSVVVTYCAIRVCTTGKLNVIPSKSKKRTNPISVSDTIFLTFLILMSIKLFLILFNYSKKWALNKNSLILATLKIDTARQI